MPPRIKPGSTLVFEVELLEIVNRKLLHVPELPEVDAARRLAARVALGRRIVARRCARPTPSCSRIRRPTSAARSSAAVSWRSSVTASTSGSSWTAAHGSACTSAWRAGSQTPQSAGVKLVSHGKGERPPGWPPRFTKLHLTFADGGELVLADGRRLGRVRLRRDPRTEPPISAARLRRAPRAAARRRDSRRSSRRARRPDQGAAARPDLRGRRRELDCRRGALPGAHRPQPPRRLAVPAGEPIGFGSRSSASSERRSSCSRTATATRESGSSTIAGAETRPRSPRGASAFATTRSADARPPGSPPSSAEVDLCAHRSERSEKPASAMRRVSCEAAPDGRQREAYSLYVERAAAGANEADGLLSSR